MVREDVQSGDVRAGETGVHGRGDGDPGGVAGVWAAPGHAQCDVGQAKTVIGGVERKMHYFVLGLPHSDRCFVKAYPADITEAFCDGHVVSIPTYRSFDEVNAHLKEKCLERMERRLRGTRRPKGRGWRGTLTPCCLCRLRPTRPATST